MMDSSPMTPRHLLVPLWLGLFAFFIGAEAASAHHGPSHAETEVDEFEEPDATTVSCVATILGWGIVIVAVASLSRTRASELDVAA